MVEDKLACPFCGAAASTLCADDGSVECPTCGAFGPVTHSGFDWNTRHSTTADQPDYCGIVEVNPDDFDLAKHKADHGETGWQAGMEYAATMVDNMAADSAAHDAIRKGVDCPRQPDVAWAEDIAESIRDRAKQGLTADHGGKVDVGESELAAIVARAIGAAQQDTPRGNARPSGYALSMRLSWDERLRAARAAITAFRQHSAGGMDSE